jgi:hypothetical protein
MTDTEIRNLAIRGAALEIADLERRLGELRAEFPAAAKTSVGRLARAERALEARNGTPTTIGAELRRRAAAPAPPTIRKRKPISAKHRRAIAKAQRARWRAVRRALAHTAAKAAKH